MVVQLWLWQYVARDVKVKKTRTAYGKTKRQYIISSLPQYPCTRLSLPLAAAGALTQGHLLQALRVNSFIHFKPVVTPLLVYRIPSSKLAPPPFLILFNLNWYLLGCPVKCVQFKDIILLLEMVGAYRIERWRDSGGLEVSLSWLFHF